MPILDIICSDITAVGQSDFTANGAVSDVAVNNVAGNGLTLFDASGRSKFSIGDNFKIRKIWAVIPWGFGPGGIAVGTYLHLAGFNFFDGVGLTPIPPLINQVIIPTLCDPLDFGDGLYVPVASANLRINLTSLFLRVSQINLPAILNGTRIPVQYYMEILHNLPLNI